MSNIKAILENLNEKWYKGVKSSEGNRDYREIFKNPSRNEILDIERYGGSRSDGVINSDIRFIADKKYKEVYITSADVFHRDIMDEVDVLTGNITDYFSGMGRVKNNGNIELSDVSDYFWGSPKKLNSLLDDIVSGDYDWMERYNFSLRKLKYKIKDGVEPEFLFDF